MRSSGSGLRLRSLSIDGVWSILHSGQLENKDSFTPNESKDMANLMLRCLWGMQCWKVEMQDQFTIRGGIIDYLFLTEDNLGIELWGDEIDSNEFCAQASVLLKTG